MSDKQEAPKARTFTKKNISQTTPSTEPVENKRTIKTQNISGSLDIARKGDLIFNGLLLNGQYLTDITLLMLSSNPEELQLTLRQEYDGTAQDNTFTVKKGTNRFPDRIAVKGSVVLKAFLTHPELELEALNVYFAANLITQ